MFSENCSQGPILKFAGPYRFLSNFYPAMVELDGVEYATVEHAYQAAKTPILAARQVIREQSTPGKAKMVGRYMRSIRPDWDDVKMRVMEDLLLNKFSPLIHPYLVRMLLETGARELIEGNNWGDRFWGAEEALFTKGNWIGDNNLGKLLMKIRRGLR